MLGRHRSQCFVMPGTHAALKAGNNNTVTSVWPSVEEKCLGGHENKTVSTAGIFSKTLGGTFGIRVLYVSPKYLNLGFVRF